MSRWEDLHSWRHGWAQLGTAGDKCHLEFWSPVRLEKNAPKMSMNKILTSKKLWCGPQQHFLEDVGLGCCQSQCGILPGEPQTGSAWISKTLSFFGAREPELHLQFICFGKWTICVAVLHFVVHLVGEEFLDRQHSTGNWSFPVLRARVLEGKLAKMKTRSLSTGNDQKNVLCSRSSILH